MCWLKSRQSKHCMADLAGAGSTVFASGCRHAMTPCLAPLSVHAVTVPVQAVVLHLHRLRLQHMVASAGGLP